MRRFARFWRDSASLIVLARTGSGSGVDAAGCNYKVLVFKRPERSSFMPNAVVFPGGAFSKQDCTLEWNRLLSPEITQQLAKVSGPRPPIFETDGHSLVDRNVSLRLCSLRETFEELGVLLATEKTGTEKATGYGKVATGNPMFDVASWQRDVHDGRREFRELCEVQKLVPDVASLYEWATWITPTIIHKKRFETAFFLVALSALPPVLPEVNEVKEYYWDTPSNLLEAHACNRIWLTPPQAYEVKRLSYVHDIDKLISFAKQTRDGKGSAAFCPVAYSTSDGTVLALPGDDLYPKDYDYVTDHTTFDDYKGLTAEELRAKAKRLHRLELGPGLHTKGFFMNQRPSEQHLHLLGENHHLQLWK
ncbi:acyl-coenzyme A diphosphatase NUDT19-like [Anopheles bellator]|uniref:acyl-coenzyme A diphosphatase NUDT19-like n=1 Tax=Anopheles bellator TaxID=139047 RepID=UPI002648AB29|nr:acyl-coenzyme A diphosphatase NUDT19-like [Anopheles bellator]